MRIFLIIIVFIFVLACNRNETIYPDIYIYKYKEQQYKSKLPLRLNITDGSLRSYQAPSDIDLFWPQPLINEYYLSIGDIWESGTCYTSINKAAYVNEVINYSSDQLLKKIIDKQPFDKLYVITDKKHQYYNENSSCKGIDTVQLNNYIREKISKIN